jgi:hypothetical protein
MDQVLRKGFLSFSVYMMQIQLTVAQKYKLFIEVDKFQNINGDEENKTFMLHVP